MAVGLFKPIVFVTIWILSSTVASAQDSTATMLSGVQCQKVDSNAVADPKFGVDNFNASSQALLVCHTADNEAGPDVFISGLVPLTGSAKLTLKSFLSWAETPSMSDIFVNSTLGTHPLRSFPTDTLPLDENALDAILGISYTHTVTKPVCTTTYENKHVCTTTPQTICKIVYGRQECTTTNVETCSDQSIPTQTCHDESVEVTYRHPGDLDGYVTVKPDSYCPYGVVEKQTKTVYGRVFNERRCCESKVVDGVLKNVCTDWQAF